MASSRRSAFLCGRDVQELIAARRAVALSHRTQPRTLGLRAMHLSKKIVLERRQDKVSDELSYPQIPKLSSRARCLIMSGVSASSVVRSTPLYSILIANCAEAILCASTRSLDGIPTSAAATSCFNVDEAASSSGCEGASRIRTWALDPSREDGPGGAQQPYSVVYHPSPKTDS
jgi:hypothetical protein